jgi:glutamate synthase domain-containing protein 1
MCGIAGLIHKGDGGGANIGGEMTSMLQALKHRGPDSTGYGLYGMSGATNHYVMRFKVAEQADVQSTHKKGGFDIHRQIKERKEAVDQRLSELGAKVHKAEQPTEYAYRYVFEFAGEMQQVSDFIEDLEGVEILSIGRSLELIKDLGDADHVSEQYDLDDFKGTHAIGHTRMATESDVDIRSAHPYWAYPYNDISVVHNGQLTNYWLNRRSLEHRGHRFVSSCDSELIAVYIADRMDRGDDLEAAMQRSIHELDGVFTYLVGTEDSLGMAKDTMAAKPMVLYESDDFIGLASEEVAIRSIFPHEIDTYDPYEEEVRVWHR